MGNSERERERRESERERERECVCKFVGLDAWILRGVTHTKKKERRNWRVVGGREMVKYYAL